MGTFWRRSGKLVRRERSLTPYQARKRRWMIRRLRGYLAGLGPDEKTERRHVMLALAFLRRTPYAEAERTSATAVYLPRIRQMLEFAAGPPWAWTDPFAAAFHAWALDALDHWESQGMRAWIHAQDTYTKAWRAR